jgi:hypothetical protein
MQKKLVLTNDTQRPLEVMVEINPDRYVLQPRDEMVIEGGEERFQPYFHINVYDGGIQVYPPLKAGVSINGKPAEPVWDPLPSK